MILCLDIGNTQIYGGVYNSDKAPIHFRYSAASGQSSDQHGIFLKSFFTEHKLALSDISRIAICSVVPNMDYSLRAACIKYFGMEPFFLKASQTNALEIKYHNPDELGADRIANAIAARHKFPTDNIIIVDFGTATTICAINNAGDYLGGMIFAGIGLSMRALQSNTAKLCAVEILRPSTVIGQSTKQSLQSGLYYSQLSTIKSAVADISQQFFNNKAPIVIGTGGFAQLFESTKVFNYLIPDLVLQGLQCALTNDVKLETEL